MKKKIPLTIEELYEIGIELQKAEKILAECYVKINAGYLQKDPINRSLRKIILELKGELRYRLADAWYQQPMPKSIQISDKDCPFNIVKYAANIR